MSTNLKDKIEQSISDLKKELESINDATSLSKEIYLSQLSKGQATINQANQTTSIDERINLLVTGLNEMIDLAGKKSESVQRKIEDLKLKIEVLEEQLPPEGFDEIIDEEESDTLDNEGLSDEEKKN